MLKPSEKFARARQIFACPRVKRVLDNNFKGASGDVNALACILMVRAFQYQPRATLFCNSLVL